MSMKRCLKLCKLSSLIEKESILLIFFVLHVQIECEIPSLLIQVQLPNSKGTNLFVQT